jgi:acetyltransferase
METPTLQLDAGAAAGTRRRTPAPRPVLRLRALRSADLDAVRGFLARVHPDDRRLRFHGVFASERAAVELARHDSRTRWAFAVVAAAPGSRDEVLAILNVARVGGRGEWALLVRSDLKGRGLGTLLLDELVRRAQRMGLSELYAETFPDNHRLVALARRFGHALRRAGSVVELSRAIEPAEEPSTPVAPALGVGEEVAGANVALH